jgi:hypothetical protein
MVICDGRMKLSWKGFPVMSVVTILPERVLLLRVAIQMLHTKL